MQLTKHFTLAELTHSAAAERKSIPNKPTPEVLENLKMVASTLEQIRSLVGGPLMVSSGYRSPAVNRLVGGSARSAHMDGLAADIFAPGMSALKLARLIRDANLGLDQLIYEGSWVHVGLALEVPRGQVLTASFKNGKATYSNGIA